MPRNDLLVRFGFGAGVSLLAAVASKVFGPFIGGVFLAFLAILLASLTLVAKQEGVGSARDDARGAALGTIGLLAFALTTAVLLRHHSAWLALAVATAAWPWCRSVGTSSSARQERQTTKSDPKDPVRSPLAGARLHLDVRAHDDGAVAGQPEVFGGVGRDVEVAVNRRLRQGAIVGAFPRRSSIFDRK
ncbi:DUF3147 family protein [Streptomyces sp. NPDC004232]|uniref:DUF3147 family protein n=1 Tax=Streptomyces sp. NPDC004232 TaxID=3154454 RepID=UPI0033A88E65